MVARNKDLTPGALLLKKLGRRVKGKLALCAVLFLCDAILAVAFYAVLAAAVCPVLLQRALPELSSFYLAAACAGGRFVCHAAIAVLTGQTVFACHTLLHQEIVLSVVKAGPFSSAVRDDLSFRLSALGDYIAPYFSSWQTSMRQIMVLPLIMLAAIAYASPVSALFLLGMTPLIPFFMILTGKKAQALNERQLQQSGRLAEVFYETLSRLPVLHVFNLQRKQAQHLRYINRRWRIETIQILYIAFLSALALEFFATVGVAFCAITLGFAVYEQGFPFELALFVLLCAPEYFVPLRRFGQNFHVRQKAMGAASSLAELFAAAQHNARPAGTVSLPADHAPAVEVRDLTVSFASDKERLTVQKDLLGNPAAEYSAVQSMPESTAAEASSAQAAESSDGSSSSCVLQHLNLHFAAGELSVLSGPSGCGKTTLLNVLSGVLNPQQGEVLIDGQPLQSLKEESVSALISFMPQNPYLFFGTVRDNLRAVSPEATDAQMMAVLEQAGGPEFLSRLPQGLSTQAGDAHSGLSGGQIRTIALARALLKGSPVLLLDEPTASLDAVSEQAMIRTLISLRGSRTIIVAAHRPELIAAADREIHLGSL